MRTLLSFFLILFVTGCSREKTKDVVGRDGNVETMSLREWRIDSLRRAQDTVQLTTEASLVRLEIKLAKKVGGVLKSVSFPDSGETVESKEEFLSRIQKRGISLEAFEKILRDNWLAKYEKYGLADDSDHKAAKCMHVYGQCNLRDDEKNAEETLKFFFPRSFSPK